MPESNGRGALTEAVYYILLSLTTPLHGYGIMQNIKEMSSGRVNLGSGTLYGAITTLLDKKWIQLADSGVSGRKKEYLITTEGLTVLNTETKRLEELLLNGKRILGGVIND